MPERTKPLVLYAPAAACAPTGWPAMKGLWAWMVSTAQRRPILTVIAVAALVRLAAAVLLGPLRGGVVAPDEKQYLDLAAAVASGRGADSWQPGYGQSLFDATSAFMTPLTVLTKLFGPHQLSGQLLAASFGVLTAALTTMLALRVTSRLWACAAGLIVALLPSQVFWSSLVLRESMVWTCLVAMALAVALTRAAQRRLGLVPPAALAAVALWGLGNLRGQTAVVAGAALFAAAFVGSRRHRVLVPTGAAVIALVVPMLAGLGIGGLTLIEQSVPRLSTLRTALSIGAESAFVEREVLPPVPSASDTSEGSPGDGKPGSSARPTAPPASDASPQPSARPSARSPSAVVVAPTGERYAVDEGAGAAVSALPRGLVAVAFRPLPWEPAPSAGMLLAKAETVFWCVGYALGAIGLATAWRRLDVLAFPVLVTAAVIALSAITQGNLGTAFRHRGQVLWAVALLAALGLHWLTQRRRLSLMATQRSEAVSEAVDVRP